MPGKFCDEDLLKVTVKLPKSLHEKLTTAADKKGIPMSVIVRAALIIHLEAGK
jgi:hypothetical protein